MIVARKPDLAPVHLADPRFDAGGVVLSVLRCRVDLASALHVLMCPALWALWPVEPGEEIVFKPSQQGPQLFFLLASQPELRLHLKVTNSSDVFRHD